MLGRIHGRLLAEWAAMLGACLAAAGCQTNWVRSDANAPLVTYGDPNPSSPGTLPRLRGDRRGEPPAQAAAQGQVVSMLRPVAVESEGGAAPQTVSGWNTIQRTGAEQVEPPLAPPAQQVLASSEPAAGTADPAVQPVADPPEQLSPPTALPGPQIVDGAVVLPHGPPVPGSAVAAPKEFDKRSYPMYIIEPPDILLIQSSKGLLDQPVSLTVPVGMDGTINLGTYGMVYVAGLTVEAARDAVIRQLALRVQFVPKEKDQTERQYMELNIEAGRKAVSLQVVAYNSKVYYLITDGGGYGATVARFPATGNETVLDALSQIGGLPNVASKKKIWLARATPGHGAPQIMPVDWCGIALRGEGATNYQIFPGDRIYVGADPWVSGDTWIARRLAPIQNVLGTILLGSTTVNSIKGRSNTGVP
jgi:polysaccharide export outer membrane protein